MEISPAAYGRAKPEYSAYSQAFSESNMSFATGDVLDAFQQDVFSGVGSLEGDIRAAQATPQKELGYGPVDMMFKQAVGEKETTPITQDDWKNSDMFREGLTYTDGMTKEIARIRTENYDEQRNRDTIMQQATLGQTIGGFAYGLTTGIVEPKNLATGIAVTAAGSALTPVAGGVAGLTSTVAKPLVKAANIIQRINKMKGYKKVVALAMVEGGVSAGIAEPSNRSSAKTLQQDYTMADTLLNIGGSVALSGLFSAGGRYLKLRGEAAAINGGEVNITPPVATDTPLDVALPAELPESVISKDGFVADESGTPVKVYHGTDSQFSKFKDGITFLTDNKEVAKGYGDRVIESYLKLQDPLTFDFEGKSTVYFDNKWRTPSDLANRVKEISDDIANHYSISEDLMEEISQLGYDDLSTIRIDGLVLKNIDDVASINDRSIVANHYVVFDSKHIQQGAVTLPEKLNAATAETKGQAFDVAVKQLEEGRNVEVEPVLSQDAGYRTGAEAFDPASIEPTGAKWRAADDFKAGEPTGSQYKNYSGVKASDVKYIEGVAAELEQSFKGQRIFTEVDGQGGTDEVTGFKGNSPKWFRDWNDYARKNKGVSTLTKEKVRSVANKMIEGKPLGKAEIKIAETIFGQARSAREKNIDQMMQSRAERSAEISEEEWEASRDLHSQATQQLEANQSNDALSATHPEFAREVAEAPKPETIDEVMQHYSDKVAQLREQGLLDVEAENVLQGAEQAILDVKTYSKAVDIAATCLTRG
jgi:hypothetical protein